MKQLLIGVAAFLTFCTAAPASAQEVASTLNQLAVLVKPGDSITLVDVNGRTMRGRVASLSDDLLRLQISDGLLQLGEQEVATITQRRSDSLTNGALIGAASGAAYFAVIMAIFSHYNDGGDVIVPTAITGGAMMVGLGAAAGAGIDALIARRQVIFRAKGGAGRVQFAPLVGNGRRGATVTVRF